MNLNGESQASRRLLLLPGVELCTTGLTSREREAITAKAVAMGATVDNELSGSTTHLACGGARGPKYDAATTPPLEGRVAVVGVGWIDACYGEIAVASENDHGVPPFLNLRVCVSGLEPSAREAAAESIKAGGGTYAPSLEAATTDVLVCGRATGAKYEAALAWKVPCVGTAWLEASVEAGRRRAFEDYALTREEETSRKRKRAAARAALEGEAAALRAAADGAPPSACFDGVVAFIAPPGDAAVAGLLDRGQGCRSPLLCAAVTHVVVPAGAAPADAATRAWAQHATGAIAVRAAWVAASAAAGARAAEAPYRVGARGS